MKSYILRTYITSYIYYKLQVIQRRKDGSANFQRDWDDYRHGFGNLTRDYWIG